MRELSLAVVRELPMAAADTAAASVGGGLTRRFFVHPSPFSSLNASPAVGRMRTDQLLEAAAQGQLEAVERWLSAGAEPSAACEGHDNWAGLHYASQRGDVPVSEALIRHGAQIEAVTSRGRGCLHLAAQEGGEKHIAVMDLLLSSGANANLQTPWGATPLHDAAFLGQTGVVQLLLEHGALPHIEDQDGKNAWDVALAELEHKALDAIKEHVVARLSARARLALASAMQRQLNATSPLRLLAHELIEKVVARIPSGVARGTAARTYRYLKQTERVRVRTLLREAAEAAASPGGSTTSNGSASGAAVAVALLPVPFTPLNEQQLKRRRDSVLYTGSPPKLRSREKPVPKISEAVGFARLEAEMP